MQFAVWRMLTGDCRPDLESQGIIAQQMVLILV